MPEPQAQNPVISVRRGRNVFETPPRISVIIPAYNVAPHIAEALDSVIAQKFREHEIIVVNDGSPDTEQLERALFTRLEDITYIKQRNAGAGAARNTGIEQARGEMIAFLDGDDIWLPDFLASQYVFLQRHGYDMVYCDAHLFGNQSAYRRTFMESAPSVGEPDFAALLSSRCNVITSGTMARRSAIVDAGMFENERVQAEDFHLWLRMAKLGSRMGYQRKQLVKYRVRTDGLSGDTTSQLERAIDVYQRVEGTIDLTGDERETVTEHLATLEANLAVEQGKTFLLRGDYREAEVAFRVANRYRKSLKLTLVSLLTRLAPKMLVKLYRSKRPAELPFASRHN